MNTPYCDQTAHLAKHKSDSSYCSMGVTNLQIFSVAILKINTLVKHLNRASMNSITILLKFRESKISIKNASVLIDN